MGQFNTYSYQTEQEDLSSDPKLATLQHKFLFTSRDLTVLQNCYNRMKKKFISLEDFFEWLDEEEASIVSPYADFLYQMMNSSGKVSFYEWLPAISLYCLYSKDNLIQFVFKMLDSDNDEFISKKDLMSFLVQKYRNQQIFYYNFIKAVELLDIERPDKISLEQFKKIQTNVPFICYPAFRLQAKIKGTLFGTKYWDQLYSRILQQENEDNKMKQINKLQDEMKKKQQIKVAKKIEKFEQTVAQNIHVELPSIKARVQRYRNRCNSEPPEEEPMTIKGRISEKYIKLPIVEPVMRSNQLISSNRQIQFKSSVLKSDFPDSVDSKSFLSD